jgi:subtilisin family serine protease
MYLNEYTGQGVRVAVIDSGVYAAHPHVGGVEGGTAIRADGSLDGDFTDVLGHGTAVTAAIREKAPGAAILAIKVFWRTLATDVSSLVKGIDEACALGAEVINLSLGTSNPRHQPMLQDAVARAAARGGKLVAAFGGGDQCWLPGSLEGVVPVRLDWTCDRHAYGICQADGRTAVCASGYPREIPNVPRDRNLSGISFAVANATGFVARALEALPSASLSEIFAILQEGLSAPTG